MMNYDSHERRSMLMILHATCEAALHRFAHGSDGDRQIAADLKRVLQRTRAELDALAAYQSRP